MSCDLVQATQQITPFSFGYSPEWWVDLETCTTMDLYLFKWLLLACQTTKRLGS